MSASRRRGARDARNGGTILLRSIGIRELEVAERDAEIRRIQRSLAAMETPGS